MEALLRIGASANAPGPQDTPSLYEAIRNGDKATVRILVEHPADPAQTDSEGVGRNSGDAPEVAVSSATRAVTDVHQKKPESL